MATTDHKIRLSAVDKTKSAFKSLNMSLRGVRRAIFSFKTAMVGAFGAAGVGFAIQQSMQATDRLAKTADRIGTTTEALSKLQFAGKIAGIETRTLNMALQRFVRRTAEVAKGTGEAQGAIADLGLDANKLIKMPLDQRMLVLSDAFSNVENESEKLRLAFKLFDSEGAAVIQMLNEGSDSLRGFFGDAETLGLVMSQDAADGVQRANDAITTMVGLFQGVLGQTVAALAPAIETLATAFKDGLLVQIEAVNGSVRGFGQAAAKFILRAVSNMLSSLASFTRGLQQTINVLISATRKVQDFFGMTKTAFVDFEDLTNLFELGSTKVDALNFALGNTVAVMGETGTEVQATEGFIDRLNKAFDKLKAQGKEIQQQFDQGVQKAFDATTDALTDMIMGTKSASDAFRNMATSIVRDLIRMQIQQSITKPLFGAIQSSLPSLGSLFGGAQAAGGPVMAGKRYLVGERGPEMFVPNQGGQVVSNDDMGGGAPVTVNLNISTGVQQTVRTEIASMLPEIANATKAAVVDARRRGGSFAKAFGA